MGQGQHHGSRVCVYACVQGLPGPPAPGPHMMGGRPSARPALLAIHHQPVATGGMACLFCQLRVAPWGGGWRKWPFFLPGRADGQGEVCRAPRAGPGWDVTGPQLGKAPHRCPRPCPALCPRLLSGISVRRIGISHSSCLQPGHSPLPLPLGGVGSGISCHQVGGPLVRNLRCLMLAVHSGCGALPWGCVRAINQLVRRRGLSGGLEGLGHLSGASQPQDQNQGRLGPH